MFLDMLAGPQGISIVTARNSLLSKFYIAEKCSFEEFGMKCSIFHSKNCYALWKLCDIFQLFPE